MKKISLAKDVDLSSESVCVCALSPLRHEARAAIRSFFGIVKMEPCEYLWVTCSSYARAGVPRARRVLPARAEPLEHLQVPSLCGTCACVSDPTHNDQTSPNKGIFWPATGVA